MTLAVGTEIYNVDALPVIARGAYYSEGELNSALEGSVSHILGDTEGIAELETMLSDMATTEFSADGVKRILSVVPSPENWRVGEGLSEAFLVEYRDCEFPWPTGRDLKNPNSKVMMLF